MLVICLLSLQIHSLLYSAPWEIDSNRLLLWVHCPLAWDQPTVGTGRGWDGGGRRVTGRGSSQPRGPQVTQVVGSLAADNTGALNSP